MSNAVETIERRIESLKTLEVTSGNEAVIKVMVEYLENLRDELRGKHDESAVVDEDQWELEARIEKLKLVPLPW